MTNAPVDATSKPRGWMMRPISCPISISFFAAVLAASTE